MSKVACDRAIEREDAFPSFARDLPLTARAIPFAWRLHSGQRRASDQAAFILHPLEVASLLSSYGAADEVVAAGVLHDVVEDTGASIGWIRGCFGPGVAGLVASVSEDPAIESERERKAALRDQVQAAGREAAMIFAADKVAKVRELRTNIAVADRADSAAFEDGERKLGHYSASLAMLERVLPGDPLVRKLRFELEALHELPPGAERSSRDSELPSTKPVRGTPRS